MILTIELTTEETAAIQAIAAETHPEMTGQQIIDWATQQAKNGLVHAVASEAVSHRWSQLRVDFPDLAGQ